MSNEKCLRLYDDAKTGYETAINPSLDRYDGKT